MSPWWLRPPGEEPEETLDDAQRSESEASEAPEAPAGPPTIADLLAPGADEASSAPHDDEDDEAVEERPAGENAPEGAGAGEEAPRKRRRRRRRPRRATAEDGETKRPTSIDEEEDDEEDENDYESVAREILESLPAAAASHRAVEPEERKIAVFCDLENLALGVRDSDVKRFEIHLVLERLLEKGKIIVKRAYADWERYSEFKIAFHEAAIELIDIPQRRYTGKNSADIKMVVDAMDLCYAKEHLDTFVLLSGDSDFSPLVSKLKENNKYVIGIGVKNSSSNLLVDNCDEFIYYEDVWRDRVRGPELTGLTKKKAEVFSLLTDSVLALQRENKDVLWGSLIKQTMQRKKPSFNEGYYGYSTFTDMLQDAERHQIVKLKRDQRSGTFVVTGFAKRK
jgi:uncharacterized protein (TIGR00288 family)